MVSGGSSCIKYLLFCFNLLFALSGIAIVTVGVTAHLLYTKYYHFVYSNYQSLPIVFIVVGTVIFIVAFFGCCGAVKENYCMIVVFATFLAIILILELVAGVVGYIERNEVETMLENKLNSSMYEYYTRPDIKNTWDIAQHELECCGINGPDDWKKVTKNNTLPHTCCPNTADDGSCNLSNDNYYRASCMENLKALLDKYGLILGTVGVGISILEVIGEIFACVLARSIKKEYETV